MMIDHRASMSRRDVRIGDWVRRWRTRRGMTQACLADRIGRSTRWLVNVESGRCGPRLWDVVAIAGVLETTLDELLPAPQRPAGTGAATRKQGREDMETNRRELLAALAALACTGSFDVERLAALAPHPEAMDGAVLTDLEAVTSGLLAQWYTVSPSALLPAAAGHLDVLRSLLPGPLGLATRLASATGSAALLAGHLLLKVDRVGPAFANHSLATSLAREAGDGDLEALSLALQGSGFYSQRRLGDPQRYLALLDRAEALARSTRWPLLRTTTLALRAEARAAGADEAGCLRDLEVAEAALPASGVHAYGPRTPVELAAVRGSCELLLGRRREAVRTLTWTLERMDPTAASWRALVAADRDAALAAR
jgi:transcriptional regulator with XRE-family HTH domain